MAQLLIDLKQAAMGNSIAPQSVTGGLATGTALNQSNGDVSINAVVDVGAMVGTNFTIVIEESATSTGLYTTVAGVGELQASGMTQVIAGGNQQVVMTGLRQKQWVRARVSAILGTSVLLSVDIIEQAKYGQPTASGSSNSPAGSSF